MTTLQALAADLADVDMVFHAVDQAGVALAKEALTDYESLRACSSSTAQILDAICRRGFVWGQSDGN